MNLLPGSLVLSKKKLALTNARIARCAKSVRHEEFKAKRSGEERSAGGDFWVKATLYTLLLDTESNWGQSYIIHFA